MAFGRSRCGTTYAGSGRHMSGYYTRVCLRCGWAYKPPRHLGHRLADCDRLLAEMKEKPEVRKHARENLYGTRQ